MTRTNETCILVGTKKPRADGMVIGVVFSGQEALAKRAERYETNAQVIEHGQRFPLRLAEAQRVLAL